MADAKRVSPQPAEIKLLEAQDGNESLKPESFTKHFLMSSEINGFGV